MAENPPCVAESEHSFRKYYEAYDELEKDREKMRLDRLRPRTAFEAFKERNQQGVRMDGFKRMEACRKALAILDEQGWARSFHQRMFHENFIRACARIFFKTEPDGEFQRAHQTILDLNGWDTLSQEILISTPRRFGKTISVSMFAAAMIFSGAAVEISIYSTCQRISQKLLGNIRKFLALIYKGAKTAPYKVLRGNMEELMVQGPEGDHDIRIVNSYPSMVRIR